MLIFSMHSYAFSLGPQYSANDSSRIMVSSADSRIRIVQGLEVIQKYKGMHLYILVCYWCCSLYPVFLSAHKQVSSFPFRAL